MTVPGPGPSRTEPSPLPAPAGPAGPTPGCLAASGPPVPIVLAAPDARALHALADRVARTRPAPGLLPALARDLAARAGPGDRFRAVLLAREAADLAAAPSVVTGVAPVPAPGRLAFLYSGQSSQRVRMGEELGATFGQVRDVLDRVCRRVDPELPVPLGPVLSGATDERGEPLLDRTEYTQPALLAFALALTGLLDTAGVRPDVVCGHSFGELAAAAAAGVWSLPDAAALAVERGRLIGALPPGGAMAAVEAGPEDVAPALDGTGVVLSAVHGPGSVVIAGPAGRVREVSDGFAARGVRTTMLAVGGAYHSPAVEPVLEPLRAAFARTDARRPSVPLAGNASGTLVDPDEVATPDHWLRHCRQTVRWSAVMDTLRAEGTATYLEIGPSGVLSRLAAATLGPDDRDAVIPALQAEPDEPSAFLGALARLDARGHPVDWPAVLDATTAPN